MWERRMSFAVGYGKKLISPWLLQLKINVLNFHLSTFRRKQPTVLRCSPLGPVSLDWQHQPAKQKLPALIRQIHWLFLSFRKESPNRSKNQFQSSSQTWLMDSCSAFSSFSYIGTWKSVHQNFLPKIIQIWIQNFHTWIVTIQHNNI